MKIKFKELVNTINEAPTGSFVGLTDYKSQNGDIVSVIGHIGASYGAMRAVAIQQLKDAIENDDFEAITVEGQCYWDEEKSEWNPRKRSCELKTYDAENHGYFPAMIVKSLAMQILNDWENPKERKNNGTNLSEKENGLVYNAETGTFNFTLLVEKETYKGKEEVEGETEEKVKCQAPETKVKDLIRKRFEKKIKSYTISEGQFKTLSIGGVKFNSKDITF